MATTDLDLMEKCDLFLHKLYEKHVNNKDPIHTKYIGRDELPSFSISGIGDELGFDWALTRQIVHVLDDKRFIYYEYPSCMSDIAIKAKGIEHVLKKKEPKKRTNANLKINSNRSNIQLNIDSQGNVLNGYTGDITFNDVDSVLTVVQLSYDMLKLSMEQRATMDREIEKFRNEYKAGPRDRSVIEKSKKVMQDILTQTGADLLAWGIINLISNIH